MCPMIVSATHRTQEADVTLRVRVGDAGSEHWRNLALVASRHTARSASVPARATRRRALDRPPRRRAAHLQPELGRDATQALRRAAVREARSNQRVPGPKREQPMPPVHGGRWSGLKVSGEPQDDG
eukprot:scaffold26357_cov116-Isochrysis_galbana.AAC.1